MFDTSALNRIVRNYTEEMLIYNSKDRGFKYFYTQIQLTEVANCLQKKKPDIPENLVERNSAELALHMMSFIVKSQARYVAETATLRPNRWILDGSMTILPDDEEKAVEAFSEVLHGNDRQHYNDAMIALTAVRYGCAIVAADKPFYRKFRRVLPDRFIFYHDFIELLQ